MQPKIFCPCREPDIDVNPLKSQLNIPKTLWEQCTHHQLEYLYFCNGCKTLRCPYCVEQQVVTRYCPSCLFEVSASTAKIDNNRCMRNCFQCPECNSTATVVGSGKDESRKYSINCNYCQWKTGPQYDRSSPLVLQILGESTYRDSISQFSNLRSWYNSLTNRPSKKDRKSSSQIHVNSELENLSLKNKQENALPLFQNLKAKSSKACKGCKRMLTKPELKPASTKFKIKLLAIDYLPQLDLSAAPSNNGGVPDVIHNGETIKLLLTITNPMNVGIKVNLAALPNTIENHPHNVTIASPNVDLGPASELWDEMSLIRGVPLFRIKRETNASKRHLMELKPDPDPGGLYHDKGPNWCTVTIEYTASSKVPQAQMILFVSYSYYEEDDGVPVEQDQKSILKKGITYNDDNDNNDSDVLNKDKSQDNIPESLNRVEVGFWAIFNIAITAN